jgi:hypothetical protein
MTYVILAAGKEVARTHCPNNAVSLAMLACKAYDESDVTVESRGVYGDAGDKALAGKPFVHPYNWQRAKYELMSM